MSTEEEPPQFTVGVLLPSTVDPDDVDLDDDGHVPAWGERGRHAAVRENRVAVVGRDVLRAAAEAVGREVALMVSGVVAGIENPAGPSLSSSSYEVDNLELRFGVKATLGAGKAIEAFLSASSEATVEVKLALRPRSSGTGR